jgi:hypothetical protein
MPWDEWGRLLEVDAEEKELDLECEWVLCMGRKSRGMLDDIMCKLTAVAIGRRAAQTKGGRRRARDGPMTAVRRGPAETTTMMCKRERKKKGAVC